MRRLIVTLLLCFTAALAPAATQKAAPKSKPGNENVFDRSVKSVVWIFAPVSARSGRIGSGSLIDVKDRIVITNYHVVGNDAEVYALFPIFDKDNQPVREREPYFRQLNSATPKARVIAREPKLDLAIIQLDHLPKNPSAIPLARESARTSATIHCIGNSGASTGLFDYCKGEVRNLAHAKFKPKDADPPFTVDAKMLEHTAPINKGQSGGPVLNDDGELVGVTQGSVADESIRGISVAVDLSEVKEFLRANKFARIANAQPAAVASATVAKDKETPTAPAGPDPKEEKARRESTAAFKLQNARDLIAADKKDKAIPRLEEIIENFADTKAAAEAKKLLDQIR